MCKKKYYCFVHLIVLVFGHFVHQSYEIQKYYVIFVYISQGKTEENRKKITQLKWPKYQKPKDKNMGWTKHKKKFCFFRIIFNPILFCSWGEGVGQLVNFCPNCCICRQARHNDFFCILKMCVEICSQLI